MDLLRKASGKAEKGKRWAVDILTVYREVVSNDSKICELQQANIKLKNATDILAGTAQLFDEMGLASQADEARMLSQQLTEKVGESKKS